MMSPVLSWEPSQIGALALALIAAGADLATGRIPNALTYSAFVLGIALGLWPGAAPELLPCLLGIAVALVPGVVLFAMGAIGGGDVKLLGALGALLGTPLILDVLLSSVVCGVIMSIGWLLWRGRLAETLKGMLQLARSLLYPGTPRVVPASDTTIPMGLAVALGVLWTMLLPGYRVAGT